MNLVLSTGSCIYVAAIEISTMDGHEVHLRDVSRSWVVFPFVCYRLWFLLAYLSHARFKLGVKS